MMWAGHRGIYIEKNILQEMIVGRRSPPTNCMDEQHQEAYKFIHGSRYMTGKGQWRTLVKATVAPMDAI